MIYQFCGLKFNLLVNESSVLLLLFFVLHLELVSGPSLEDVLHHRKIGPKNWQRFEEPDSLLVSPIDRLLPLDPAAVVCGTVRIFENLTIEKYSKIVNPWKVKIAILGRWFGWKPLMTLMTLMRPASTWMMKFMLKSKLGPVTF